MGEKLHHRKISRVATVLHIHGMLPLQRPFLRIGLPSGSPRQATGWRRGAPQRQVYRLRLLHPDLSVPCAEVQPDPAHDEEVQLLHPAN